MPAVESVSLVLTLIGTTEAHELSRGAVEIGRIGGLPITNSMVVTWIVAIGLILVARVATRQMKGVPDGLQNFAEWLIESLYNFLAEIIGPRLIARTFWLFAT